MKSKDLWTLFSSVMFYQHAPLSHLSIFCSVCFLFVSIPTQPPFTPSDIFSSGYVFHLLQIFHFMSSISLIFFDTTLWVFPNIGLSIDLCSFLYFQSILLSTINNKNTKLIILQTNSLSAEFEKHLTFPNTKFITTSSETIDQFGQQNHRINNVSEVKIYKINCLQCHKK